VQGILVVGSYNAGLTVSGPRLPVPGETVVADSFAAGPGGKGANQAIGARRLGADVAFIAKLGDDVFGREARVTLLAEGLPEWGLLPGKAPTGVAFILVDAAAENMIAIAPGANLDLSTDDVISLSAAAADSAIVMLQLECEAALATGVATWARASGKRVMLNPAPARDLSTVQLALFDIITPNELELRALATFNGCTGDSPKMQAKALVSAGVPNVIVTMGRNGALWVSAEGVQSFPAYPVQAAGRH
jgi:ribokinase